MVGLSISLKVTLIPLAIAAAPPNTSEIFDDIDTLSLAQAGEAVPRPYNRVVRKRGGNARVLENSARAGFPRGNAGAGGGRAFPGVPPFVLRSIYPTLCL